MKVCSICGGKHYAKGLCTKHYDAQKNLNKKGYAAKQSARFRANNPGYDAEYRAANRDKCRLASKRCRERDLDKARRLERESHARNRDRRIAYNRAYREENRDAMRAVWRAYAKSNPEKNAAQTSAYRASKLRATPIWAASECESFVIAEMYDLAVTRKRTTGMEWHVDHIVPLRSDKVCGLHCMANMQVIPGTDNYVKGNRYWPDM